jgi:FdhE protein
MADRTAAGRGNGKSEWGKRIARAEELTSEYAFASEMLRFYVAIARFQERLHTEMMRLPARADGFESASNIFERPLDLDVAGKFKQFLSVVDQYGPGPLREAAREVASQEEDSYFQLLTVFWTRTGSRPLPAGPSDFFARAFLQPYAELLRERLTVEAGGPTPYVCPYCGRKPGFGVLRPLGDGGQRSLVCSFCLGEWEFRRIVCPGCGEENHEKLPVYTAEELKHVRVEACDSCRTYIKTVDLTKSGRAEPVVDEMASIPLDLWAGERGYTKLQPNLLQF